MIRGLEYQKSEINVLILFVQSPHQNFSIIIIRRVNSKIPSQGIHET